MHGVNVLLSDLGALALAGNACTYYFLNILIDTTLGVGILYAVLHLLTHLFSVTLHLKGFESGQYGRPPQWRNWARQLGVYVASLTTMKLAVIGLFFLFPGIFKLGEWALSWLGDSEHGQVVLYVARFFICELDILTSRLQHDGHLPHPHERSPILAHRLYRQSLDTPSIYTRSSLAIASRARTSIPRPRLG